MTLSIDLIPQFLHKTPKDHYYVVEQFKRDVFAIWLCCSREFTYNNGKLTKTIWGFYNYKTYKFHSPVNSKTIGKLVDFKNTTQYTSMPIKITPLERAFR
jgi:hypothetical protein